MGKKRQRVENNRNNWCSLLCRSGEVNDEDKVVLALQAAELLAELRLASDLLDEVLLENAKETSAASCKKLQSIPEFITKIIPLVKSRIFPPSTCKDVISLTLDILTKFVTSFTTTTGNSNDNDKDCQVSSVANTNYITNASALAVALAGNIFDPREEKDHVRLLTTRALSWAMICIQDLIRPSLTCSIPNVEALLSESGSFDSIRMEKELQIRLIQHCTVNSSSINSYDVVALEKALSLVRHAFIDSMLLSQDTNPIMKEFFEANELKRIHCFGARDEKIVNPMECVKMLHTKTSISSQCLEKSAKAMTKNEDDCHPFVQTMRFFFDTHPW